MNYKDATLPYAAPSQTHEDAFAAASFVGGSAAGALGGCHVEGRLQVILLYCGWVVVQMTSVSDIETALCTMLEYGLPLKQRVEISCTSIFKGQAKGYQLKLGGEPVFSWYRPPHRLHAPPETFIGAVLPSSQ